MKDGPTQDSTRSLNGLFADHSRQWQRNLYVYPVISRRSEGLSIGVNLNPARACNFDCVYCQVDRSQPALVREVDMARLRAELEAMLDAAVGGSLFEHEPFNSVPPSHARVRDIAFSGDGEPTLSPRFAEAARLAVELSQGRGLDDLKLRVITNATRLTEPAVWEALTLLHEHNGEIWAKLDAGTEAYYARVNRSRVPLAEVLLNIRQAARSFRVVIQSLWMKIEGQAPSAAEIEAFAHRLSYIFEDGGKIQLVQIYTTARQTAEAYVTPLSDEELAAIARRIRSVVDVPLTVFGSH